MSKAVLQQAKALINELSSPEKAQLVEWLGSVLGRELMMTTSSITKEEQAPYATQIDRPIDAPIDPDVTVVRENISYDNGEAHNALWNNVTPTNHEIPWEERPWTEEEIRDLMKPEPKTGAEIAALLDRLDLSEWQAMDIPDVVEWLKEQRHQEAVKRGLYWDQDK